MEGELGRARGLPAAITLADVAWAVRTERLTGDSAGYGQIVPLDQPDHDELQTAVARDRSARSRRR